MTGPKQARDRTGRRDEARELREALETVRDGSGTTKLWPAKQVVENAARTIALPILEGDEKVVVAKGTWCETHDRVADDFGHCPDWYDLEGMGACDPQPYAFVRLAALIATDTEKP